MKSPKIHPVLVYTDKGRYSRVVDLWIYVAHAAIGFRRASKTRRNVDKKILCVLFTAVELEKNVTLYEIFRKALVRTSTAHRRRSSKKTVVRSTRKNKSNDLEPHFPTSATKSRSLEDTKTAVALPH